MSIVIIDPDQLIYEVPFPIDHRFAAFINGIIMNEGDEYVLGPNSGEITLGFSPNIGDLLDFRRL